MGDHVEILKTKSGHPSRDWLTPSLGFLRTSRAHAKILHWFKTQNKTQHIIRGEELLSKAMRRLDLKKLDTATAAIKLNFKTSEDLLAALGNGKLKLSSILHTLKISLEPLGAKTQATQHQVAKKHSLNINIHGIGNLLKRIANCCKPTPDTAIIGYVAQGRGISIHRTDCINVLHIKKLYPARFIAVSWNNKTEKQSH